MPPDFITQSILFQLLLSNLSASFYTIFRTILVTQHIDFLNFSSTGDVTVNNIRHKYSCSNDE